MKIAARDYERMEATGRDIIPQQELDHQGLVVEGAKVELEAAQTQLEKFEKSRPIQQREAEAKLATAKANQQRLLTTVQLESLKKGLVAAAQKLELSVIRAPARRTRAENHHQSGRIDRAAADPAIGRHQPHVRGRRDLRDRRAATSVPISGPRSPATPSPLLCSAPSKPSA